MSTVLSNPKEPLQLRKSRFLTLFRSSWRPSIRKRSSSCESCWLYPANWSLIFPMVILKSFGLIYLYCPVHRAFIIMPNSSATSPLCPNKFDLGKCYKKATKKIVKSQGTLGFNLNIKLLTYYITLHWNTYSQVYYQILIWILLWSPLQLAVFWLLACSLFLLIKRLQFMMGRFSPPCTAPFLSVLTNQRRLFSTFFLRLKVCPSFLIWILWKKLGGKEVWLDHPWLDHPFHTTLQKNKKFLYLLISSW